MKLRKGFVSNSSSSSFVCDICGFSGSFRDDTNDLSDFGMAECLVGHQVCMKHLIDGPELDEWRQGSPWREIPKACCPTCQGVSAPDYAFVPFLLENSKFADMKEARAAHLAAWQNELRTESQE